MQTRQFLIVVIACLTLVMGSTSCRLFPPPTPLPQTQPPEWQGIIIGQSTITDVIQLLGEPPSAPYDPREELLASLIEGKMRWWSFSDPSSSLSIHVCASHPEGIVQYIEPVAHSKTYPIAGTYPPTMEKLLEMYGEPERVTWASISMYERLYIWASKGVAVEGRVPAWTKGAYGAGVSGIEYFVPTDVESYLNSWGRDKWPVRGFGEEDAYHNPQLPWPYSGTPEPES
jgi:hypothetical protein